VEKQVDRQLVEEEVRDRRQQVWRRKQEDEQKTLKTQEGTVKLHQRRDRAKEVEKQTHTLRHKQMTDKQERRDENKQRLHEEAKHERTRKACEHREKEELFAVNRNLKHQQND